MYGYVNSLEIWNKNIHKTEKHVSQNDFQYFLTPHIILTLFPQGTLKNVPAGTKDKLGCVLQKEKPSVKEMLQKNTLFVVKEENCVYL